MCLNCLEQYLTYIITYFLIVWDDDDDDDEEFDCMV